MNEGSRHLLRRRPRRSPPPGTSCARSCPSCATSLLLVGFASALRFAELAENRVEHIEASERGLRLTLPRSKGDRTGKRRWQEEANINGGAVFRRIWVPPTRHRAGEGPVPSLVSRNQGDRCRHGRADHQNPRRQRWFRPRPGPQP